jgi:hypothetical protein
MGQKNRSTKANMNCVKNQEWVSGAIMKYDKKTYDITLSKNNKTSRIEPSKVNIDTKQNVLMFM